MYNTPCISLWISVSGSAHPTLAQSNRHIITNPPKTASFYIKVSKQDYQFIVMTPCEFINGFVQTQGSVTFQKASQFTYQIKYLMSINNQVWTHWLKYTCFYCDGLVCFCQDTLKSCLVYGPVEVTTFKQINWKTGAAFQYFYIWNCWLLMI